MSRPTPNPTPTRQPIWYPFDPGHRPVRRTPPLSALDREAMREAKQTAARLKWLRRHDGDPRFGFRRHPAATAPQSEVGHEVAASPKSEPPPGVVTGGQEIGVCRVSRAPVYIRSSCLASTAPGFRHPVLCGNPNATR
jgi:hypothetical protein